LNTQQQYKENHRVNEDGVIERRCTACKDWKEENFENFYCVNKKVKVLRFTPECKICATARTKANTEKNHDNVLANVYKWQDENKERTLTRWHNYNLKNRDKQKAYTADYQKSNPEKMTRYAKKHRNHDITDKEWDSNQKAFDYKCAYCGMSLAEHKVTYKQTFHKEHVDDDGYNDIRNCVPSCQSCNSTKGNKTIDELFQLGFIKNFSKVKYNKIVWWITEGYKDVIETKPPYRVLRKRNEGLSTYHWELWTVDEKRNTIECVAEAKNKKGLDIYIKEIFNVAV